MLHGPGPMRDPGRALEDGAERHGVVARIKTVTFIGIEAVPVDVQVQIGPGAVAFTIVGLPDKAVGESRERVRAALQASGLALPARRVTVNLAPADLPKEGSHFDLPIALGLMSAMGAIQSDSLERFVVLGELALDGNLAPVAGVLPAAVGAGARDMGLICPAPCGAEAAWASADMELLAPRSLVQLVNHFKGMQTLTRPRAIPGQDDRPLPDLAEIRGQETARRALEIAAAGGHNLLMIGPPGAGKSMLAQRLPSILPALSPRELLEVSMIASVGGTLASGRLQARRPFRAPHHSASMPALVGGGTHARPGEVSLAHNGILFLDEIAEFPPQVLDSLRQPLESGSISIVRANHRVTYPSRVQLVAAMNPCKCGYAGTPGYQCRRRGTRCVQDYQARLSGPFLDRIDLRIHVPALAAGELLSPARAESSAIVARRVQAARDIQAQRYQALGLAARTNAAASADIAEKVAEIDAAGRKFMRDAVARLNLTARGFHRILKLGRTIADLDGVEKLGQVHLAEALAFRGADFALANP